MLSLRRPESPLLRTFWDPLVEDVLREVEFAVKVAMLGHQGLRSTEIADRLGIQLADVFEARRRLKRARARLEHSDSRD
jgi:DNA-directed RNA polymerase specialized sigma24 family protein